MRAGRADVPEDCGGGIIAALEGKEDSERAGSLRTQGTQPPPPLLTASPGCRAGAVGQSTDVTRGPCSRLSLELGQVGVPPYRCLAVPQAWRSAWHRSRPSPWVSRPHIPASHPQQRPASPQGTSLGCQAAMLCELPFWTSQEGPQGDHPPHPAPSHAGLSQDRGYWGQADTALWQRGGSTERPLHSTYRDLCPPRPAGSQR